jgi:hypothetical protein
VSTIRLQYDTDQQRWTLTVNSDTHRLILPVQATMPNCEEFLPASLSPIDIELPPYAQLSINLVNQLSGFGGSCFAGTPPWAQGGTLERL